MKCYRHLTQADPPSTKHNKLEDSIADFHSFSWMIYTLILKNVTYCVSDRLLNHRHPWWDWALIVYSLELCRCRETEACDGCPCAVAPLRLQDEPHFSLIILLHPAGEKQCDWGKTVRIPLCDSAASLLSSGGNLQEGKSRAQKDNSH